MSQRTGKEFESILLRVAADYERRGILTLRKVDPPTRVVRQSGRWNVVYLRSDFTDFVGCWTERAGRTLFLEAKSTEHPTLDLCSDSGLTQRQWDSLRLWHQAGAAVGVLWYHDGRCRFLSHNAIQEQLLVRGVKRTHFEEGSPVSQGTGFTIFDFAQNLRSAYPFPLKNT